jgi:hypothetical protein
MNRLFFVILLFLGFFIVSCQKEIDWGIQDPAEGDLLVKALQITPATNDTNVITFQWDANKRLLVYKSTGKVNGTATDILYTISRLADGKIGSIVSKSSLTAGFIDSVVYTPVYLPAGSQMSYVIDTQYTVIGPIADSSAFVYDAAGMITSKETFTNLFGFLVPTGKTMYTYDGSGNVTHIDAYSPNGAGGYDPSGTNTFTYDSHKNAAVLGDESFIVIGAENFSKNNATKSVNVDIAGGTTYTSTFSQQKFNSYNRPKQSSLSITPNPPGYDLKLLYYYQ